MTTPASHPMTTHHYNLLAASFAEVNRRTSTAHQTGKIGDLEAACTFSGSAAVAIQTVRNLKEDNPRVDAARFIRACAFPHYLLDTIMKGVAQ